MRFFNVYMLVSFFKYTMSMFLLAQDADKQ